MRTVSVEPVSVEGFARFGKVLPPAPQGRRVDHRDLVRNLRPHARPTVAQVKADDVSGRGMLDVALLERHPYSSQTFFPLDVGRYLVVVCDCAEDGGPDPRTLQAFSVPGNVGIHYHPGTWHMGISALAGAGDFLMLVHEDQTPDDCEFRSIAPVRLML